MVTGANGFIGRALVHRLLAVGTIGGEPFSKLILLDRQLTDFPDDVRIRRHPGSVADAALLRRVFADGVDVVFHLASVPGGAAEQNYELGYHVNLCAALELLDQLRVLPNAPVLVYASSVAVYGDELPMAINETTTPRPALSYGAHKWMVEIALTDLTRRGAVKGRAIRLPGIVARPRTQAGLRSAFMSDLLHAYAAGEPYQCPVSIAATAWWMSVECCVDNLLWAANCDDAELNASPICQLPALRLSIAEILRALATRFGEQRQDLISFAPDPDLEALFGRFPLLHTPKATALGFRHDGDADALIGRALGIPAAGK